MSVFDQRAQIFSVAAPKPGTARQDRRYRVKWRIDGRDKTRSFKTRTEAERLRARLQMAVIDGERFDVQTGLPVAWTNRPDTWWDWSQKWLAMKWPQWSGHTRRSAVESLVALTPAMVRAGAPPPPDDLTAWLRTLGYRAGGDQRADGRSKRRMPLRSSRRERRASCDARDAGRRGDRLRRAAS